MNEVIFLFLNQFQDGGTFTTVLIFILADILILSFAIGLFVYFYTSLNHRKAIKDITVIILAGFVAWAMADVIKYIFPSDRPFMVLESANALFERGGNNSFPSGHTAFISSIAMMFYFYNKKISIWMFIAVFFVGIGRVMSGMHWPVDILGGFVLGVIVACAARYVYVLYQKYYSWSERLQFWK